MLKQKNDGEIKQQMQNIQTRVCHDCRNYPPPAKPPISLERLNFATGKVEPR